MQPNGAPQYIDPGDDEIIARAVERYSGNEDTDIEGKPIYRAEDGSGAWVTAYVWVEFAEAKEG